MPKKIVNSGFTKWKPSQLPKLNGKTYVITGANSGIGFTASKYLGDAGADIVMVCRSVDKARKARQELLKTVKGKVDIIQMDLSDLSSVRHAAEELRKKYNEIDALINNAGIMMTPQQKTVDGFDLQMGANHLGHFLWTGLLLDLVEAAKGRVVVLSSLVHKYGEFDFNDFMTDKKYTPVKAYTQSKLANLMFALDLDRRLKESGRNVICIACHPGYTDTNLQSTGPAGFMKIMLKVMNKLMAQKPSMGALPTVLSAAGSEAKRGAYYGPQRMSEYRGDIGDATVAEYALNKESQNKLWDLSEKYVDYKWDI